ncbi:MAG: DNA polymerase III subunit gamma/tau, partial [Syntrophobacteraceae bacterium]|nr:DNA polymerase III subunit gamma/tau [Syntrophobacteraceae bacterium]
MSYLVIARKWRPQTFEEVVGQHHVTRTLQNAVLSGRVAHAYLFTGARGVGKTSVARILARSLNCESGPSTTPCNTCSNCREITQGNAVDVLEIDGASNRGIDNIRELKETVRYRPAKSRYKIYIIDEVHMLTTEAFNALLKTLEEPPEHVVFVFATTEPHKIPATILSRCQRFDFRRIPAELLLKQLKEISGRENVRLSDDVLFAIAREADGSMRDAQSLLEQLLAFSGEGLSDEEILDVLGVVDRRSVHKVGSAILAGDVQTCLEVVGDLYRRGIDSRRFCQQLCDHFRNLLVAVLDVDGRAPELRLPEEEDRFLREQAAKTTSESLYLYLQLLLKGEEDIRRSSTPRIALEMLLLRMTQMPALESIDTLIGRISDLERRLEAKAAAVPSAGTRNPAPQAPAASPVVRGIEKAGNEVAQAPPPRPVDPVHEPVADCRE